MSENNPWYFFAFATALGIIAVLVPFLGAEVMLKYF